MCIACALVSVCTSVRERERGERGEGEREGRERERGGREREERERGGGEGGGA